MAPLELIDSHIHLWPEETSNEQGHSWMTPGMPLAKSHLLKDYYHASRQDDSADSDVVVNGVVYIETDVRYDAPSGDLATWAKGPLDEILFLRSIVESKYGDHDSDILLGLVPWLPIDQPTAVVEEYLTLAKDMAGPKAWPRVKGFRLLLQSITDQTRFEKLVFSDAFTANLKLLGKRGLSFDVGVDQHSGGIWQLEAMVKAMEKAHADVSENEKVVFILNHLCKPDFAEQSPDFSRWCGAVTSMSKCSRTYMKLSGAFSELPESLRSTNNIADHIKPWVAYLLSTFGAQRMMFGSDWPVCNLNGPAGADSWMAWKDVVQLILNDASYQLAEVDRQRIWSRTAAEVYRIT